MSLDSQSDVFPLQHELILNEKVVLHAGYYRILLLFTVLTILIIISMILNIALTIKSMYQLSNQFINYHNRCINII